MPVLYASACRFRKGRGTKIGENALPGILRDLPATRTCARHPHHIAHGRRGRQRNDRLPGIAGEVTGIGSRLLGRASHRDPRLPAAAADARQSRAIAVDYTRQVRVRLRPWCADADGGGFPRHS